MTVSDAIKNAYKNNTYAKILNISFPNLDYTVPVDEVYYESMSLDESIFDSDSFEAVGCIASRFAISIRDTGLNLKDKLVTVSMALDGLADSDIPLFYGYVDSVEREAQKKMQKIEAYDALYSVGNTDIAEWYNNLTYPITLVDFRNSLFSYIGLSHESVSLPNDSIRINKEYTPNTMKAIDAIKSICQINGCFGMMNRQGVFEYRFLNTSGQSESVSYYRTIDYKDYVVNPVDQLTIRQRTDDKGITVGTGDNTYIIQGNMFTYNLESSVIFNIATNIYTHLKDIEYIPFEATNNGYPWIEVGKNCILDYSVYDFDNSTPSQSVYKDVSVVAFKRSMSGIQNLQDKYSAEGQELQREFISDLSAEFNILQQTVDNLIKKMSTEITTYRNSSAITINAGQSATIADLVYEADKGNTVIFHEEADLDVVGIETLENNTYIENDVVGTVRYFVNGYRLPTHLSEAVLTQGKHILNLTQFWQAGVKEKNRMQAILTVENGSVTIQKLRAQAYITVKQSDYNDAGIEVTTMPNKIVYQLGETLDFTGLVVSKVYFDETIPSENITARCTFTPAEGSTVTSTDLIEILVTYTEIDELGEEKTYETSFYLSTQYLTGIYVEQEPAKTEYYVGDNLALAGIRVMADYADGSTKDVTSQCTYSPADGTVFEEEGNQTINISYTEHGITATTEQYLYVAPLEEKTVWIIDHDDPSKMYSYDTINEPYDVIKAKISLDTTYTHEHDDTKDVHIGDFIEVKQFGPCHVEFSIKATGAIVLTYTNPVTRFDEGLYTKWARLYRLANHSQFYSSEYHNFESLQKNFYYGNLAFPEYGLPDGSTLSFARSQTSQVGLRYTENDGFSNSFRFKFEMSPLPICSPIDSTEDYITVFDFDESTKRYVAKTLGAGGFDTGEYVVRRFTALTSTIPGPSEFNGDVFAPHPNHNIDHLYIVSGPHAGTIGQSEELGFNDIFFSEHSKNEGIAISYVYYSNGGTPEMCAGIQVCAFYYIPVNVSKTIYTYGYDIEGKPIDIHKEIVDEGNHYLINRTVITIPFSALLYVGREGEAPEWALNVTEEDM